MGEIVKKMVNNPKFKAALKAKIGANVDASELKTERESYRKSLQQCIGAKNKLYDNFTDLEKKKFMQSFIEEVQIYEQPKENGRFLKSISFAFPVYYKPIFDS